MEYDAILIEPVLSEKSNVMRELGQSIFKVDSRATKPMIMEAVAKTFNVHPVSCKVINVTSKPKRLRGRLWRTAEWKKPIVWRQKGETMRVFEGA